jgi:hypothetical protein
VIWISLVLAVMAVAPHQVPPCPVEHAIAYNRETTPGTPPDDRSAVGGRQPISTSYFIYLVAGKGCPPIVTGVWVKGEFHGATVHRVVSPVRVANDAAVPTGESIVLVPKTSSDVYEVRLGDEARRTPASDEERRLAREDELVVVLQANGSARYCTVKTITRLPPAAGQ